MYNVLNWPDYNLRIWELMRKQDGCQVIVTTNILMVGIDFPDISDVVIIGHTGGKGAWNQWLHVENIESFGWMSLAISW